MWFITGALIGATLGALVGGYIGWFACEEYSKTRHVHKWSSWKQLYLRYDSMWDWRNQRYSDYCQTRKCEDCGCVETVPCGPCEVD
jgi:hypothetical protein